MNSFLLYGIFLIVGVRACDDQCKTDDDCKEGECCMVFGYWPFYSRICSKYIPEDSTENVSCQNLYADCMLGEEDIKNVTGNYYYICPCASGLTCSAFYYSIPLFDVIIDWGYRCTKDNGTDTSSTSK